MLKQIKTKFNKYKHLFFLTIIVGLIIHLPLFTKDILSADILLNNTYYSGYSWEVSLGRFGLFIIGLLKSYIVIPHIELFLSLLLVGIISIELIDLFQIKNKLLQVLTCIILVVCPNVSTTLLFNYCSLPYTIAFASSITAIYLLLKANNKYLKYIIPAILIIIALSMYQAYLTVPITLLVLYYIKDLLTNKFDFKETLKQILVVAISIIMYFILMKLSQLVLHIDMSNYTNASSFGLKNILSIPLHILTTYQVFFDYFFRNTILTNTTLYNHLINALLLIVLLINIVSLAIKNKISLKNKLILLFFVLTLPIYFNCILLIMPDATMQLLMSSSYILLIPLIFSLSDNRKVYRIIFIVLTILLIRNYTIQDNATYKVLEITNNKTYTIALDLTSKINELGYDKQIMITGNLQNNDYYNYNTNLEIDNINNLTYGYISEYSLFWDEYTNTKNGWTRYFYQYLGTNINFVDEETYNKILSNSEFKELESYPDKDSIKLIDNVIVIKI